MVAKDLQNQSEDRKYELQLQLEHELGRASLQTRTLERTVGFLKSGGALKKQVPLLNRLTNEKWNVETDLFIANGEIKKKDDSRAIHSLVGLLDEHDSFDGQIKKKKNALVAITEEITKMMKQVSNLKKKVPTEDQCIERLMNGRQALDGLEHKLDMANQNYCTITTENRVLRDEITHLLIDRTNFNKMWFDYISNLHNGKKFMMDIIEQATIAYDRRDECVHRLNALRGRAYTDFHMHTTEMEALQKKLDCDHQLEEFLGVKGQLRNLSCLSEKKIQKQKQLGRQMTETLNHHKIILKQIKDFTKIDVQVDQQSLTHRYYKFEEQNMNQFLYVNDLHREVEDMTRLIVAAHDNIDKQKKLYKQRAEQQTNGLKRLKAELAVAKSEADKMKLQSNSMNSTLKSLYKGITKLFNVCNCNRAPFLQLLGQNTEIHENNVLLYLTVLEERVSSLLLNVYLKEKSPVKKGKELPTVINEALTPHPVHKIKEVIKTNPCPLCVDRELVSDIIDDLQFVQTKTEVKDNLTERLKLPNGLDRLHNVSACNLPQSRAIIQKRYQ